MTEPMKPTLKVYISSLVLSRDKVPETKYWTQGQAALGQGAVTSDELTRAIPNRSECPIRCGIAQAVCAALATFGAPVEDIRVEDLADRTSFIRFGRDPLAVDIHSDIPGVDFDAA